jgi:hypothetical protein
MTNNKRVLKALNGFMKLSAAEKLIFRTEVNDYRSAGEFTKKTKEREVVNKLGQDLGPTSDDICPCCGKS